MKYPTKFAKLLVSSMIAASMIGSAADAAPVFWNLNGVSFADGGTASGSFVYDADADFYPTWSISVTGGTTAALPAYTYITPSGFLGIHSATMADFVAVPTTRYIRLSFLSALTNSGGTIGLNTATSFECNNCSIRRNIVTGSVTSAGVGSVPEPASWALMLLGFGATGYAMRRRQRTKTALSFAEQRVA
jgi:hypothetical protein